MNERLFEKFYIAVKALSLCCEEKTGSTVALSEVYNETWMLRLTLAALHDHQGEFAEDRVLYRIKKALAERWISEGGLHPAFKGEGDTWTDAILGCVELSRTEKRKVEVSRKDHQEGIIVVEAKMGSELASGVTNSPRYNQVARNIACLARLCVQNGMELCENSGFVVMAPRSKLEEWKSTEKCPKKMLDDAVTTINDECRNYDLPGGCCKDKFMEAVRVIANNSTIINWESIVEKLDGENKDLLNGFYEQTKRVSGVR